MFITTRLNNRFPLWTKIRTDPSSLGYRLSSVWADYFEWAGADNKRIDNDTKLIKRGLGIGYLYQLELVEGDLIPHVVNASGEQIFTYPSSVIADTYTVERVDNIDDLCWSPPTRLTQINWEGSDHTLVYEDLREGTFAVNTIEYPCHLLIEINGSLNYFQKTRLRNPRASGKHLIEVKGKDVNGTSITEHISIRDDGYYWTRNVFTELDEIIPEGFDGSITATIGEPADFIVDPFQICVLDDGNEGPLKLEVTTDESMALLRYYTDLAKQGENYRDGVVEIVPNDEDAWEQYLLDDEGDAYEPVDIAIHPNTTRLYALDSDGFVHVYKHGPSSFTPPSLQSELTKNTYLEATPLKPWARMNETMRLFTRFVRIRFPILGVKIKRVKPDNTTEYLQADKTWAAGSHEFLGKFIVNGLPEETWADFDFTCTFDEFGQWEFYTEVRTAIDRTVSYTGVMVDGLEALVSLDTELTDVQALMFGPADELVITTSSPGPESEDYSHYAFQEHSDYYLADPINQIIYTRESYNEVDLTTTYEGVTQLPIPCGLDLLGINLGHTRIDGESLYSYHRRLILETREPAGPTEIEFIRSVSRQVGEFDLPVLRIDLILDGDEEPLAEDPYIEITSSRLRAYSNYEAGELDVEVDFTNRADGYFLRDIEAAISASSFFTVEILDEDYELKHSSKLRYSNTDIHVTSELLLPSTENKLTQDRIKSFYPSNAVTFSNEVSALTSVVASGDYYVDYTNGVVYSFDTQSAFCSYTYSDLPFTLYYQAVRVYPLVDDDKRFFLKDGLISDTTGELEYVLLNHKGADIANTVLAVHPMSWGS